MPKFRCDNPDCKGVGQTEIIPHVRFIWNEKTGKLEAAEAACSSCGEQREVVKEKGPIQVPWFKPENAKNYNNKTIKKYDYDHDAANASRAKLSDGSNI